MTLVPAVTPVTTPLLVTVATPVLADTHGLVVAAVADPVNVVVLPTHTLVVPLIVGRALTVTIRAVLELTQPVVVLRDCA